ncbi:hypothetical protein EJV47_19110 [Hymenobacter gummosus]|uniref:Carboxypeptidase-like regulatory domain-containing protein n=1 Tax=Hymenobacter gummosus TaxID=1776032 RepID=A0A3S0H4G2_9BACT|nr:carboxypeptidase regulatory-like domain-containing protein [Hymenobacter gummosus]RTQ47529.1 hypothetical protein EJV47_19110 [Hymenobacter gummosus]
MFSLRSLASVVALLASLTSAPLALGSTGVPAKQSAKPATARPTAVRVSAARTTRLKPVLVAPTTDIFHEHRAVKLAGWVTGPDGMPLPGATVWLTATRQQFTVTNAQGDFLLTLPSNAAVSLTIGYEGYEEQVVVVSQPRQENGVAVTLKPATPATRR